MGRNADVSVKGSSGKLVCRTVLVYAGLDRHCFLNVYVYVYIYQSICVFVCIEKNCMYI